MTDDTIKTCTCIAAETHWRLFMREGCQHARWVIIGHRIAPREYYGVPVSIVVCIEPDRVREYRCKFLSLNFLFRAVAEMNARPRALETLSWMDDQVRVIRASRGISGTAAPGSP
jgi:hypothetical protein